jgi:hypothetical protein
LKQSIKEQRENAKIAQLLGIDPEIVQSLRDTQTADDKIREAQAVLLFIEKPEAFFSKKCDNCHEKFLTTYQFVSVCSTLCRIAALEKVGISYNPLHTPEERWKRSQIPTEYSIPPKAVQLLIELAQEQLTQPAECETYETHEQQTNTAQLNNEPLKSLETSPPSLTDFLSEDYEF